MPNNQTVEPHLKDTSPAYGRQRQHERQTSNLAVEHRPPWPAVILLRPPAVNCSAHSNLEGHDEKVDRDQIRRTLGLDSHGNFGGVVRFRDPGGRRTILR
jgi:hypothetical protein